VHFCFASRRRHTRFSRDCSSDVCSSDLAAEPPAEPTPADRTAEETARARAIIEEVVHFDFDRSDIRPDAAAILERKARVLKANPNLVVRIEGHTDERGSTEYNLALGQRRAES